MIKKTQVELISGTKQELLNYFHSFIFPADDPRTLNAKKEGKSFYSEFAPCTVEGQIENACNKGTFQFFYIHSKGYEEIDNKMTGITISIEQSFIHVLDKG